MTNGGGDMDDYERVKVPRPVIEALVARYRAKAEADRALADYLEAVLATKRLDRERFAGIDDQTGDLLLRRD